MFVEDTAGLRPSAVTTVEDPACEPFVVTVPYPAGAAAMSDGFTDPSPGLTGLGTHGEAGRPPAPVGTSL